MNFLGSGGVGSDGGGVAVPTGGLRGVDGGALVADLGHEPVDVVGGVLGGLDPAVGEGDHVAADDDTGGVLGLGLLEVGLAVVVVDTVLVGEGLGGQLLLHMGGGGVLGADQGGQEEWGDYLGVEGRVGRGLTFHMVLKYSRNC